MFEGISNTLHKPEEPWLEWLREEPEDLGSIPALFNCYLFFMGKVVGQKLRTYQFKVLWCKLT